MKIPKPRKLPSGAWHIQLRLDGKSISITDPDQKKCIAKATAIKGGILSADTSPGSITLTTAIDRYIQARSNTLSPSTIRGYRAIQRNRFLSVQTRQLSTIDKNGWQRICNQEAELCNPKTLTNAWRFLSSVIYEATGQRYDIRLPQVVPNDHPFLEPEQIKPFLAAVQDTPAELIALLALHSLRRSEIHALTARQVDFGKRLIYVEGASVYDADNNLVTKQATKNKSSRRTVPIMIDRLYTLLLPHQGTTAPLIKSHVCSSWRQINAVCSRAGLPLVGVHGLRHSFASLAYHLNIPEKIAMEIGGWKNDQTMRKIYTHVAKSDLAKYTTAMSDFFNDEKNANENANANLETLGTTGF